MNKLIYAIGIAIASAFLSSTKIEHHKSETTTKSVEKVSQVKEAVQTDSSKLKETFTLP